MKVFARNAVFEGPSVETVVKTKYEGKKEMCVMSVVYYVVFKPCYCLGRPR